MWMNNKTIYIYVCVCGMILVRKDDHYGSMMIRVIRVIVVIMVIASGDEVVKCLMVHPNIVRCS